MSIFIDTNILLYAVLKNNLDVEKQQRAFALLDRDDCVLSVQVLNEFTYQAMLVKRQNRLGLDAAVTYVRLWRRFPVQDLTLPLYDAAVEIVAGGGFSFWDAMIVAAARAQGCELLYSEDMHDGRIIGGMRIVNPFR